ncbi:hypothetical protein BDW68DRAFT_123523 [Aspergillus falconensis]
MTCKYLTQAGDLPGIRAALTCIFCKVQDTDDQTGNGEFQTMYASEYSSLRVCRNDCGFISVARACCIDLKLE